MYKGFRSEQKPYPIPWKQTNYGAQGFIYWLLQDSHDRKCISQQLKLRKYFEHIKVCWSSQRTQEIRRKRSASTSNDADRFLKQIAHVAKSNGK